MSVPFSCTACGRCCHGLRLPLSSAEALAWLERGGGVEIMTDAAPAAVPGDDAASAYRRARALPGVSGSLPILVNLTLAASFTGACPHLLPSMLCGAYDARPNACRIYPAEVIPGRRVDPAAKQCPPDAWRSGAAILAPDDEDLHDTGVTTAKASARAAGIGDVAAKTALAALLGVTRTALTNQGLAVHRPDPDDLRLALREVARGPAAPDLRSAWTFMSPDPTTQALIRDAGGQVMPDTVWPDDDYIALV